MSKRKEKTPTLADWELVIDRGPDNPPGTETVQQARWRRDERGYHTFRDHEGVVAEFIPGVVYSIRRKEPPVVVHPPGWAAGTGDEAEVLHAEHHPGTIVPSLDSCPEHDRADYEARVRRLSGEDPDRQSGYEVAGPEILPVKPHRSKP